MWNHFDLVVGLMSLLAAVPTAWVPPLRRLLARMHLVDPVVHHVSLSDALTVSEGIAAAQVDHSNASLEARVDLLETSLFYVAQAAEAKAAEQDRKLRECEERCAARQQLQLVEFAVQAKAGVRVQAVAGVPAALALILQGFQEGWSTDRPGHTVIVLLVLIAGVASLFSICRAWDSVGS